ncbi:MAG: exodeoxyribonuclease III [Myxococcota bacterium]|jgi:exodeoxyribonuclease-3|nr:exodeoxyribonuclease III [Myxococcota bacterium]
MRVISWNVNGLRAISSKLEGAFLQCMEQRGADLVGVQEARLGPSELPDELAQASQWWRQVLAGKRAGYSGVAAFSRRVPDETWSELGKAEFDDEARFQLLRFGALYVANVYFPAGHGPLRDNSRVPFKLAFYRKVHQHLGPLMRGGAAVLVMGDFNIAHQAIDLANPQSNKKVSGFLPEERAVLDTWQRRGWVDTFRRLHPADQRYSWWSQRTRARERNVGWRLDYVWASPRAMKFVREAFILDDQEGSDHCPVGVDLDDAVLD